MSEPVAAQCVYTDVEGRIACSVHCEYWPCDNDGRPASVVPVHTGDSGDDGVFTREQLLHVWRAATGGQRPLVIHHGRLPGEHRVDASGACWCDPQPVAPDPVML